MHACLDTYAHRLDADLPWNQRVAQVTRDNDGFTVSTAESGVVRGRSVVAASGGFARPYRPPLPGLDTFAGVVPHSAEYRTPSRTRVAGSWWSAVQIAVQLARTARVGIATRGRLRWQPQRILGRDFHWWLTRTGPDASALGPRLARGSVPVIGNAPRCRS